MKNLYKIIGLIGLIMVFALGLFFWPFKMVKIIGGGMGNEYEGSMHLSLRIVDSLNRNQVVLYNFSGRPNGITRIVGLPGEKIELIDGQVFINGTLWSDGFDLNMKGTFKKGKQDKWVLKDEQYFVLGDNRLTSWDSREFGPLSISDISGKIIW